MRSASRTCDDVLSDDYDSILFGSPTTLRNFTGQNNMEIMDLSQTVIDAELSYDQLVDAAILTGTDYNDGVHGIGPVTATKKLKEHGDIFEYLQIAVCQSIMSRNYANLLHSECHYFVPGARIRDC